MVEVRIFMGYAGPKSYGLWVMAGLWVIPPIPSREPQKVMCYKGLWVMRGMGYEGVDCTPYEPGDDTDLHPYGMSRRIFRTWGYRGGTEVHQLFSKKFNRRFTIFHSLILVAPAHYHMHITIMEEPWRRRGSTGHPQGKTSSGVVPVKRSSQEELEETSSEAAGWHVSTLDRQLLLGLHSGLF